MTTPKRVQTESVHSQASGPGLSSSRPLVDEATREQLAVIGMRARKAVSEGYLTRGSLPSYQGDTVGTLDQASIARHTVSVQADFPVRSNPSDQFRTRQPLKRSFEEDDEDTDDDGDLPNKPSVIPGAQAYFVPSAYKSHSQTDNDLPDADFLQPRESFN